MARQAHHGRRWGTVRARVLRQSTVCWLCGGPGADSVDRVVPVSLGGAVFDPANLKPAHLVGLDGSDGNISRGNRANQRPPLRTSRDW